MIAAGVLGAALLGIPAWPTGLFGLAGLVYVAVGCARESRILSGEVRLRRRLPKSVGQGRPFDFFVTVTWHTVGRRGPVGIELHTEWPDDCEPLKFVGDSDGMLALDESGVNGAFDESSEGLSDGRQWQVLSPIERSAGVRAEMLDLDQEFVRERESHAGNATLEQGFARIAADALAPVDEFVISGPRVTAAGAIEIEFNLHARAKRRGTLQLGRQRVWLTGRFLRRRIEAEGRQVVRVEPPMLTLRRTLQLVATERFWDQGVRRIQRARGGQHEFESLRDYVPGDEPRRIDWKAFARRGKPMVREFEPERGQEVIVMIDCGRRMGVQVDALMTKLDRALDAGLEFASAVLSQRDKVGLMLYDSGVVKWVAPAGSRRQFQRFKEATYDVQLKGRESDLAAALRGLNQRHRRRALVIILSDAPDPAAAQLERRALAIASKHRVIFAALSDPSLLTAAESSADPLEKSAAEWLLDERSATLETYRSQALVVDMPAIAGTGALLRAWFQERRRL